MNNVINMKPRHAPFELLTILTDLALTSVLDPDRARSAVAPRHDGSHPDADPTDSSGPYARVLAHRSPTQRRLTTPHEDACYLLTSRICSNEAIFGPEEMRMFRDQLERTALFCGVTVLNYTLLPDHFHLLIEVPRREARVDVPTATLLKGVRALYGDELTDALTAALEERDAGTPALEHFGKKLLCRGVALASPEETAQHWAERELARLRSMMHDVCMFMKLLKQRFSLWYNSRKDRYGTLYGDTFRSLLVERAATSIKAASSYIDLNAVRRGLVEQSEQYAFCGAGEAQRGAGMARTGLSRILNWGTTCELVTKAESWASLQRKHQALLWEEHGGASPKDRRPPMAHFFLYKHDLFLRGLAVGSREYIRQIFSNNREAFGVYSRMRAAWLLYKNPQTLEAGSWGFDGMWVLRFRELHTDSRSGNR
jgi:putative transposase